MKETDSRECRNCHDINSMSQKLQSPKAWAMHQLGKKWGNTCIDCHQGIAHTLPRGFDKLALMDELHERMEDETEAYHENAVFLLEDLRT